MSKQGNPAPIAVIILNYNNFPDTKACLECFDWNSRDFSLIVIDNCSTDDSWELLCEAYTDVPSITLIKSPDNRGYAAGNNQGIRHALQEGCEYICLLNNDTILDPASLEALARYLDEHPECAMVGPLLCNNDESRSIQSAGAQINLWSGNVNPLHSKDDPKTLDREIVCGYISGACIMFRAQDVARLGYLPEDYFLYFEETEWCLKASRMLGKIVCLTDTSIIHLGSATAAKMGSLTDYLMTRNRAAFERRNASKLQLAVFVCSMTAFILSNELRHHDNSIRLFGYMCDGLLNRVRPEFKAFPIKA